MMGLAVIAFGVLWLAAMSQQDDCLALQSRHQSFFGSRNHVLVGVGYRSLTGVSVRRCGVKCLSDDSCFSFNYWEGTAGRCELNNATATRFPMAISTWTGGYYFGSEKPPVVKQLLILAQGDKGPPGLTDRTYNTQASASADCQTAGQHLCELWEVEQAYAAGYDGVLPVNTDVWYAVPDSQAVVNGSKVTQHGLPMTTPALGICCPGIQLSPQDPFITSETYDVQDVAGQARGCSLLASHPCMLPELKAAYLRGYRHTQDTWPYFAVPNRDTQLLPPREGCGEYVSDECYEDVVPNTPRPWANAPVFCCPNLYQ